MRAAALAAVLLALAASGAAAEREQAAVRLVPVVRGLDAPVHVAALAGEPRRLYVVEQAGVIRVVVNGRLRAAPFLDIRSLVRSGGEQGLLSVAFHPDYARTRRFYVNYTDLRGDTRVVEYRSDGTRAQATTRRELLRVAQPYANHNGGGIAFGPDGRLYVGMGDGGSGGDPEDRAQDLRSQLGKLLRLDVDRAGAKPELVALGLRNPWRFSFDRATGDLWIADVGQGDWEEIDVLRAGWSGLPNFGWDVWEGRARFEDKPLGPGRLAQPVAVYSHGAGCSVTGGFVYRGKAVPALAGRYLYGDYCSGTIWSLAAKGGKAVPRREPFSVADLVSFGEDAAGELYAVSHGGTVYRVAR
ncbi:MAG: PQQ-dependent sugar dehydrogenase [Actinobacteria bacterium]|nr:PQQ-dependent sugar dehydrogenase [Actinomycetota bacterium]